MKARQKARHAPGIAALPTGQALKAPNTFCFFASIFMTFITAICLLVPSHNIPLTHILSDGSIWNYTKKKQALRYVNVSAKMQLFQWCNSFGITTVSYSYYTMTVVRLLILLRTAKASTTPPHTFPSPPQPFPSRHFWKFILYILHHLLTYSLFAQERLNRWLSTSLVLIVDTETGELGEFHLHKSQAGGCVTVLFFIVMGEDRKAHRGLKCTCVM